MIVTPERDIAAIEYPAFAAIYQQAQLYRWPLHRASDLDIDLGYIRSHPGESFAWGLRPTGTDLCGCYKGGLAWLHACKANRTKEHYFYWDGYTLAEVTVDRGRALLQAEMEKQHANIRYRSTTMTGNMRLDRGPFGTY